MLAKNFRRLMKDDRFKKKFSEKAKKPLREAELEDEKDARGPRCFECSGYGHIRADCGNLKKGKGKAYNVTLSESLKKMLLSLINFWPLWPHMLKKKTHTTLSIVRMR
jgi:hypothetical protein